MKKQEFKAIMVKEHAHKRFVESVGYGQKHTERLIELMDHEKTTKKNNRNK